MIINNHLDQNMNTYKKSHRKPTSQNSIFRMIKRSKNKINNSMKNKNKNYQNLSRDKKYKIIKIFNEIALRV